MSRLTLQKNQRQIMAVVPSSFEMAPHCGAILFLHTHRYYMASRSYPYPLHQCSMNFDNFVKPCDARLLLDFCRFV